MPAIHGFLALQGMKGEEVQTNFAVLEFACEPVRKRPGAAGCRKAETQQKGLKTRKGLLNAAEMNALDSKDGDRVASHRVQDANSRICIEQVAAGTCKNRF